MKKSNVILEILIVIVCIALGIGIGYLIKDNVGVDNKNDKNNENKENVNEVTQYNSYRISNMTNENYDITFNGINLKVENNLSDDMMYSTEEILINDIEVTNYNLNVDTVEIFDQLVIIESSDTSARLLTIYDTVTNKLLFSLEPSTFDNYWANSYEIKNNKIIIQAELCGEQCGVDAYNLSCDEIKQNKSKIYPEAEYEIKYNGDGKLSNIKLLEKTSFENTELYNKYYSECK